MSGTQVLQIPVMGKRNINTYLLLGRRPVLVDTGIPGSADKVLGRLVEYGVDPHDLALIVVTHGHIDHYGGAAELQRLTGAPIAGHVADIGPYSSGRAREPYLHTGPMGHLLQMRPEMHTAVKSFALDVPMTDTLDLRPYGIDGRVLPTPGHTAGSVSVLTDDGDLVAGDLVASSFMGVFPARPANPPFHDDSLGNLTSLQEMLALRPRALHVGHGGPLDPERVSRWAVKERRRLNRRQARGRLPRRDAVSD